MGRARRSSQDLGSEASIYDDLRIVRSVGGFARAAAADIEGTIAAHSLAGQAVDFEDALYDLESFLTTQLRPFIETKDVSEPTRIAALSLMRLLFSEDPSLNATDVRNDIGQQCIPAHDHDHLRRHEDELLKILGRRYCQGVRSRRPTVAGTALQTIESAVHNVYLSANFFMDYAEARGYKIGAELPPEIVERTGSLEYVFSQVRRVADAHRYSDDPRVLSAVSFIELLEFSALPIIFQKIGSDELLTEHDMHIYRESPNFYTVSAKMIWLDLRRYCRGVVTYDEVATCWIAAKCLAINFAVVALARSER